MVICAEYIWLDGHQPTKKLRSKTRMLDLSLNGKTAIADFPEWGYDGSSTYQAPGDKSDLVLKPVAFMPDPIRGMGNFLVMCEVFGENGQPVDSNTRAGLRRQMDEGGRELDVWIGFEQEYTFFVDGQPLGWPQSGYPAPQGPYYCGVGSDRVFGRDIVEEHAQLCIDAGIMIFGTNAEVMPAQWEFQIGYRGFKGEQADPLTVSDHLWLARWLIQRVAEKYGVVASFNNKPVKGDWNGAGAHANISTKAMRDKTSGWKTITAYIEALRANHARHINVYGDGLADRLTGHHETCDINTFRSGPRDRGASIRIPHAVSVNKCGYVEDRRPGANSDPYEVSMVLVETMMQAMKSDAKVKKGSAKSVGEMLT